MTNVEVGDMGGSDLLFTIYYDLDDNYLAGSSIPRVGQFAQVLAPPHNANPSLWAFRFYSWPGPIKRLAAYII
jgi:hypothetical protein